MISGIKFGNNYRGSSDYLVYGGAPDRLSTPLESFLHNFRFTQCHVQKTKGHRQNLIWIPQEKRELETQDLA
jgi:hypothetical protein